MHVAQVTVRVGETVIDQACLQPGQRFAIGSTPGVHLAVSGIGTFPLVTAERERAWVRAPIGTPLVIDGVARPADAEPIPLVAGGAIAVAFGLAAIEIRMIDLRLARLPRPPRDARPVAYIAASLIAHVMLLTCAIELAGPGGGIQRPRSVAAGADTADSSAALERPGQAPLVRVPADLDDEPAAKPPAVTAGGAHGAASETAAAQTIAAARTDTRPTAAPPPPDPPDPPVEMLDDSGEFAAPSDIDSAFEGLHPLYVGDESWIKRRFDPTARGDYGSIAAPSYTETLAGAYRTPDALANAAPARPCDDVCTTNGTSVICEPGKMGSADRGNLAGQYVPPCTRDATVAVAADIAVAIGPPR